MRRIHWLAILAVAAWLAIAPEAWAQPRPYVGFVYPAGGQRGTTFHVQLGGQNLDDVDQALVSGTGVSAKVFEYHRRLGSQEMTLLREQLTELKKASPRKAMALAAAPTTSSNGAMMMEGSMMGGPPAPDKTSAEDKDEATRQLIARIEQRLAEQVDSPAAASIASLVIVEVTIDSDAKPGARELRLATPRGVSNPLVFCVGQVPEVCRKPMISARLQVLGKEQLALRNRPPSEVEDRVTLPCTLNGQIASGEENRYRFEARKGQRLVISTEARKLVPFIADAVPGWFQPVLALYNADGKEVAYDDDYRFNPDPVILYEVPKDGEYVLAIYDAIYRGREDFVYRITIGELPFVTCIFPLGGRAGESVTVALKGWNLQTTELTLPPGDAGPGTYPITACNSDGLVSNRVPFARDTLPECVEREPNDDLASAQKVELPIIINGRIGRRDDWDVFQFSGHAGETIVAEVYARRLDSPLDSVLKLTDAAGKLLAFNDDHDDPLAGTNTHNADSYLMAKLPADGTYYVHLGDTARSGGEEYAYRLRISAPRPDFALRVVPSSIAVRSKAAAPIEVRVIRKDGFRGPIKLSVKDLPAGFSSPPVTVSGTQATARLTLKTDLADTKEAVTLRVEGRAKIQDQEVVHEAIAVEDRMQAFLWRHLVPAQDLKVLVFNPTYVPPPKRLRRAPPPATEETKPVAVPVDAAGKPKFTKQQVAGRLRQLKLLFEDGLLTDEFNDQRIAECEAVQ